MNELPLKSLAGALLFSVLLGPVGLLYASTFGGITMIFVGFIVACAKFPIPIILAWVGCSIWSVIATNRYNKKILRLKEGRYAEKNNKTPHSDNGRAA